MQPNQLVFVDCQTTGANPTQGQMIELAWARDEAEVQSSLIALPEGETLPKRIVQLTGITDEELTTAPEQSVVMAEFSAELSSQTVLVAHFARFERPFLEAAWEGDLPWPVICTHALAQRLLPDLPSKGLKALAGYFGHSVTEVKRAADHVSATQVVWNGLLPMLAARGVGSLADLQAWLKQTKVPKRQKMDYLIAKEVRLSLPKKPGVYRFKNKAGQVLYVGKATNLKQRVNSYFRGKRAIGPRHSEFLTQAVELDHTVTVSDVEAALLETDEIKRLNPPYNVALKQRSRRIVYFDRHLTKFQETPDLEHSLGPFANAGVFDWLFALKLMLDGSDVATLGYWEDEDPETLAAGLELFRASIGWQPGTNHRQLLTHGLHSLRQRMKELVALAAEDEQDPSELEANPPAEHPEEELDGDHNAEAAPLTPEEFSSHCLSICRHAARHYLRARSLNILYHCQVAWPLAEGRSIAKWRWLLFEGGALKKAATVESIPALGHYAGGGGIDVVTYDRLRTLRTEVKRLLGQGVDVQLHTPYPVWWLGI